MPTSGCSTVIDWRNPDYAPVYAERAERLKRIRTTPGMLEGLKAYYKDHPADFINDWALTFDPRNAERGIETTTPFLLFPRQREFIDWLHDRWKGREDGLAEKSRDMGVSWLCVAFGVWMWIFHPGTVVGFGSRKEEYVDKLGDPKSLFWKVRQFVMLLPVEFRPAGYNEKVHAPFMRTQNPETGAVIVGEAGDNIGRGNRTSIYFKDESAFYERPELIDAALSQTSNCKIDVSTPNGPGNPFYRKRHGGRIKVFTFHWKEDPRKDEAWYAKQMAELDPVIVAQEIDINYEASVTDSFVPGPLVDEAQQKGPADVEARGPIKLGLDVARFGDDSSVLSCRQGRVVAWTQEWKGLSTMDLAARVRLEVLAMPKKPAQIAVDVIGIGAGVVDRLQEMFADQGIEVVGINSSERVSDGINYNVRAQMWDAMVAWLKDKPASLPNDPDLKTQLCALRYNFRNGLRLLESKDEAKKRGVKSPDKADSLALTFAKPVTDMTNYAPLPEPEQDTNGFYF